MPGTKRKSTNKKGFPKIDKNDSCLECCEGSMECLENAQITLKEQFFKVNSDFFIPGVLDAQRRELEALVKQCVEFGESNSLLIIGPRGSGKSKLTSKVLLDVSTNYDGNYFQVYLNGLVHTDDRAALQDMSRQLELENVVGDRVFGSFSDNLAFILDALKNDSGESKSVVLVLDEFDLFAYHKNQSLLYNLFDIAQSKQNPICVIGLTCRLDVVELLEKRVKSRYSHRSIFTFPTYNFDQYVVIATSLFSVPKGCPCCQVFQKKWGNLVQSFMSDSVNMDILESQFNQQKDMRSLIRLLTPVLYSVSITKPSITSSHLLDAYNMIHGDSKTVLLKGLSTLELSLLIAAKHVHNRREGQPFNYEMVYHEYESFLKRRLSGMQHYNKAVAYKAYEHLLSLELFKCTDSISQNTTCREFRSMSLLLTPSQIKEIVHSYPECPTELRQWADSMFAE